MARKCQHKPRGIVTNQPDGYDPNRSHASISTCDRSECVQTSIAWVASQTNETAVFKPFGGQR